MSTYDVSMLVITVGALCLFVGYVLGLWMAARLVH